MGRWIKIDTDITKHWLWQDSEQLQWWLDILIMAAWREQKVMVGKQVVTVGRGQFVASTAFLCKRWKRSRTMVEKFIGTLVSERMITKVVTNNVSIISVVNYDAYQAQMPDAYLDAYLKARLNDTKSTDCDGAPIVTDAYLDAYPDAYLFDKFDAYLDAYLKARLNGTKSTDCDKGNGSEKAPTDAYLDAYLDAPNNKEYIDNILNKEKIEKEKKPKRKPPEKHRYAPLVLLTEKEHATLVAEYGEEATAWMITKMDNYKAAKGATYKSDYRAILNWTVKAWQQEQSKQSNNGSNNQGHQDKRRGVEAGTHSAEDYKGTF